MDRENKPILECSISIRGFAYDTWQGRMNAEGRETSFRSELELLQIMERLLEARQGRSEKEETT